MRDLPAGHSELQALIDRAPSLSEAYDTSTADFVEYQNTVINWFNSSDMDYAAVDAQARSTGEPDRVVGFRVALKIAESHRILRALTEPLTITLINPVYKESTRMQTREQHPHGEDSIRFKMRALAILESLSPHLHCRFFVVDDGCPDGSGEMARRILERDFPDAVASRKARVYALSEAIDQHDPDLPTGLTHKNGSNRSVKGGAMLFGMRKALRENHIDGRHIIIDNDADLSVHPEQIGLLIEAMLLQRAVAVAGSRREEDSVALIGESRNTRGRLFIQIMQHLLPSLGACINDTNRAFKAFDSECLRRIINDIAIYTFPYQIELLQACNSQGVALEKRGIAYIDSEAASTQQGEAITESYLNQVQLIADIARRYSTLDPSDPLLNFVETISEDEWQAIELNPPSNIEDLLA